MKQQRYQAASGRDWIDECADTMEPVEFRAAMRFTIGKYVRRAGKKDKLTREIEKIRDYAERWLSYERELGAEETEPSYEMASLGSRGAPEMGPVPAQADNQA